MAGSIKKVAIFGASGNFGAPITAALLAAKFSVTIITRPESTTTHPPGIALIRTGYSVSSLTEALDGQDAAICVVGPAGIANLTAMIDAAVAAGVQRFIIDDFGWGPDARGFPEFDEIHAQRRAQWDYARIQAEANPDFTWTGISTGNPIDWALKKFPLMGFDVRNCSATIYDKGTELFTGTTLAGIGQAVVGVLMQPDQTANRFVKALSVRTCQNELLQAFEQVTERKWAIQRSTTQQLKERGRDKLQAGDRGWVLDLVVTQLFDQGEGRGLIATSRADSDAELLGIIEETPAEIAAKAMQS